jgi:hypothetical protein
VDLGVGSNVGQVSRQRPEWAIGIRTQQFRMGQIGPSTHQGHKIDTQQVIANKFESNLIGNPIIGKNSF